MQTIKRTSVRPDINLELLDELKCHQVIEKLDAMFGEHLLLEEADKSVKRRLFKHLENCSDCCRSFDIRIRFRSGRSIRI